MGAGGGAVSSTLFYSFSLVGALGFGTVPSSCSVRCGKAQRSQQGTELPGLTLRAIPSMLAPKPSHCTFETPRFTRLADQVELVDVVFPREERLAAQQLSKDAAHCEWQGSVTRVLVGACGWWVRDESGGLWGG